MDARAAWFLNLDAELELSSPVGYTPNQKVRAFVEQQSLKLAGLTGDGLVLGTGPVARHVARGLKGHAWCPTPYALRQLERAGADVHLAPALSVLQHVNHRRFCAELGQTLANARFFERADDLFEFLARYRDERWLLKRGFGFAGRGQRTTRAKLDANDCRWITESFGYGGMQVEPWVEITQELALHGHITEQGTVRFGRVTEQHSDTNRSWLASRVLITAETDSPALKELHAEAALCARHLYSAGYFGPFGIDAYHYKSVAGGLMFNPRGEINARYTMGYAVGMNCLP
ncbi:MAG: hypothetical protein RJA70_972 [Pseudomonadota bacterium]|jgi:phosphoribosylaminoimidazole carboxylase (NCAIR synthetase)